MSDGQISYERRTKAAVEPPISTRDVAAALLDASELEACMHPSRAIIADGKKIGMGIAGYRAILPHIKEESLKSGKVAIEENPPHFHWGHAHLKICRKYGLTTLHYEGNRNRITGILVSSMVSIADPDAQVRRYASVIRALKRKHPNVKFVLEDCVQTTACDPKLTKVLKELLRGKQPESALEAKTE